MAIAPIFSSPCDLANRFPVMIAEFLDIEQRLKRRFREDSITDILIASLLSLPGNNVVVLAPQEAKTGGDFDLVIVEPKSGVAIQFRIQAKRLIAHKRDWTLSSYVELAHPRNSGTQSQTLIRSIGGEAIITIPLYAFYNPAHVCAASGGAVSGIELASGWEVRERIKALIKAKPKRLPYKRISSLQPLFFPLSTILCSTGSSSIPGPVEAHAAVIDAIEARSGLHESGRPFKVADVAKSQLRGEVEVKDTDASLRSRRPRKRRSQRADRLPPIIRQVVEHRTDRFVTAKIKRPKIVLMFDE